MKLALFVLLYFYSIQGVTTEASNTTVFTQGKIEFQQAHDALNGAIARLIAAVSKVIAPNLALNINYQYHQMRFNFNNKTSINLINDNISSSDKATNVALEINPSVSLNKNNTKNTTPFFAKNMARKNNDCGLLITTIYFDKNSSFLNLENKNKMLRINNVLKPISNQVIEIIGYADHKTGETDYNYWLAARRAKNILYQLKSNNENINLKLNYFIDKSSKNKTKGRRVDLILYKNNDTNEARLDEEFKCLENY